MASKPRVIVVGGYGVFGRLFATELARSGTFQLLIAGRSLRAAKAVAEGFGGDSEACSLDIRNLAELRRLAAGAFAVVCLAGPFQTLDPQAPAAAIEAGAHWLDISDHAAWVDGILRNSMLRQQCRASGLTIIPGLSSTPALSGILVRLALREEPTLRRVAITLYIGNRNTKGSGAIASACSAFPSPFVGPATIDLPFGRKQAVPFDSPDQLLLARERGVEASFSVAFEFSPAARMIRAIRALPLSPGTSVRFARLLSWLASPMSHFGSDCGGVDVLVQSPSGESHRLRFVAKGQRSAILPAALVLHELVRSPGAGDCITPSEALSLDSWLERLQSAGVMLERLPATQS